jgi:Yip1-like protein
MLSTYFGMLYQPSVSAERIAVRPNWVAPLFVLVVVVAAYSALTSSRRVDDWIRDLRANPELSAAEVERRIENLERQRESPARFVGWVAVPLVTAARVAFVAGVWWLLATLVFGGTAYRVVLAVYAYSTVVEVLRYILLFVMGLVIPDATLETGLMAFVANQTLPVLLARVLHSVDFFGIWQFVICGICLARIHGRSSATGLGIAATMQAAWTVVYALAGGIIRVI